MKFCKMCGSALAAPPVASAPAAGAATKQSCPACGKTTPSGFAFCQHCGQRLAVARPAAPGGSSTPSAGVRAVALGATMAQPVAARAVPAPAPGRSPAVAKEPPVRLPEPVPAFGKLVQVQRDGSDGQKFPLLGEWVDVGRSEAGVTFPEDLYLAPRHVRLSLVDGAVRLKPIDMVNGVFLRLGGPVELSAGDEILIGKELLRFEPIRAEDEEPPMLSEHGVRLLGTVPRTSWGRLRQITSTRTTRDVWHLSRAEVVLGREEGDITFPDDEYMSRRHAVLRRTGLDGLAVQFEDLGSSNGSYLRLNGERQLRSGDMVRIGDQLLRFEQ